MLRRGRDSRVEAKASCRDAQWHLSCIKLRQIDAIPDIPDTPDILEPRIIVFGWFFERFEASLPPEDITRHEALVKSGMRALLRRLGRPEAAPLTRESLCWHPTLGIHAALPGVA